MDKDKFSLKNKIEYQTASIVSKSLIKNKNGSITLFAFDKDQMISEHKAPYEVLIHILDGECKLFTNGDEILLKEGNYFIIKENITHSLYAVSPFKMLLVMIKGN